MSKITKNIEIIIGVIIVVAIGYGVFIGGSDSKSETPMLQPAGPMTDSQTGREILTLLLNLKSLKLDASLFNKPTFKGLVDFGQELPVYPQGRDNPFAPIE